MWLNGRVYMFLRVSILEFLVERWDRCRWVVRGIVNGLLLVMFSLLLDINSDVIRIPPIYAGMCCTGSLVKQYHMLQEYDDLLYTDSCCCLCYESAGYAAASKLCCTSIVSRS
jgi:hypothetical protein